MKKILHVTMILLLYFLTCSLPLQAAGDQPDSTFGYFTEITPLDSLFVTPPDEDFWVVSTAPADYDNDGDLDIVVMGYYVVYNVSVDEKLVLMRNDGPGTNGRWDFSYINLPLGGMTTGRSAMAWGDYDGDGDLDLAVGSDGQTVIYRNDSANMVPTAINLPGYWEDNDQAYFDLHSISWADYDNDGDMDLLIPSVPNFSTFTYSTALMRNDGPDGLGGWIFTGNDTAFAPTEHAQSYWSDCDGDGDLDLLLVNIAPIYDESFIRLYRNDGNGLFTGEDILGTLGIEHGEAQWGDYDHDGDLDILVAGNLKELNGSYTPMALRIYRNDSTNYTPLELIPNPYGEGWFDFTAATWADYDSDGDMDILLAGHYNSGVEIEGRAQIYINENGTFVNAGTDLPAPHAAGQHAGTFSWLDIDAEGDLDYLIAGEYFVPGGNGLVEAQMHLYRNDTPGQNEAPLAPSGMEVTQVSDSSVLLTWLPGSDDHTPADALTYDLKLFRDNVPVVVPAHTPEPGNVSAVTQWSLTGLEAGDYTWILRTIDASYTAGPSATGSFGLWPTSSGNGNAGKESGGLMLQNYPNPVIGKTMIRYTLPEGGRVSLTIYSSNGQEVAHLVDQYQPAGSHQVLFDTGSLPAGNYVCTLKAGSRSDHLFIIVAR